MGGLLFEKPRQDRRAATAALARDGSVAGFTARPRRPAKKDLWSSSAAARASRSYLCVLSAVYISRARMVWTSSFTLADQWLYTVGGLISMGWERTIIAVRGAVVRAGTKPCASGANARAARSFIRGSVWLAGSPSTVRKA